MSTPSRPARPRVTKPASSKVNFDFAALEADPDEPMRVRLPDGDVISLRSLQDLDWQVAAELMTNRDPRVLFAAVVAPEDQKTFLAAKISLRAMDRFQDEYLAYFGLSEGAAGESDA